LPEMAVSEPKRDWRRSALDFNKAISKDSRLEIALVSIGDGLTICMRVRWFDFIPNVELWSTVQVITRHGLNKVIKSHFS
jgi:hypothetical protein